MRESEANYAGCNGDEAALDPNLLDQAKTAGAYGGAQRHFPLAHLRAGGEEVGNVRARDEQDQGRNDSGIHNGCANCARTKPAWPVPLGLTFKDALRIRGIPAAGTPSRAKPGPNLAAHRGEGGLELFRATFLG